MPKGYLMLVLHAHLPYVRHPEYDRFLEERWFYEAMTETYIPLLKFFDRLQAERVPFRMTLSISPTLATMMEDPLLRKRYEGHLDMMIALAEKECQRTRHWHDVNFLAEMYKRLFDEAKQTFVERCGTRLVTAFREYAEAGNLELITCAGTHGFLPLLSAEPNTVRAQVFTAVQEHERIFGFHPQGMWVPECAYYPGLDEILAEAGIRYFFVDAHGIELAEPRPLFGVNAPLYCPSGVAAFGRTRPRRNSCGASRWAIRPIRTTANTTATSVTSWTTGTSTRSAMHRGCGATGIKYHRITGNTFDKHLYHPDWAAATAQRHARDFVGRCRDQMVRCGSHMPFPCVTVSPYDAELYGHWWFEGPQWLYHVLREARRGAIWPCLPPARTWTPIPSSRRPFPRRAVGARKDSTSIGSIRSATGSGGPCTRPERGCAARCGSRPSSPAGTPYSGSA